MFAIKTSQADKMLKCCVYSLLSCPQVTRKIIKCSFKTCVQPNTIDSVTYFQACYFRSSSLIKLCNWKKASEKALNVTGYSQELGTNLRALKCQQQLQTSGCCCTFASLSSCNLSTDCLSVQRCVSEVRRRNPTCSNLWAASQPPRARGRS